jgi:hypothetical protein
MPRDKLLVSAACLVFLFGCASRQKTDAPPPAASSSPQAATTPKTTPAPAAASSQPAAGSKTTPAPAPARTDGRKVKSKDGKVDGEIFGTPSIKSKFAKLEIGMSRTRVEKLIGGPADSDSHVTGRQFQPFYFGGDTQRYEAYYKSEGQLTYSNSSRGSAPDTLIIILVDTKATGKRP